MITLLMVGILIDSICICVLYSGIKTLSEALDALELEVIKGRVHIQNTEQAMHHVCPELDKKRPIKAKKEVKK